MWQIKNVQIWVTFSISFITAILSVIMAAWIFRWMFGLERFMTAPERHANGLNRGWDRARAEKRGKA